VEELEKRRPVESIPSVHIMHTCADEHTCADDECEHHLCVCCCRFICRSTTCSKILAMAKCWWSCWRSYQASSWDDQTAECCGYRRWRTSTDACSSLPQRFVDSSYVLSHLDTRSSSCHPTNSVKSRRETQRTVSSQSM